ncbi:MAG: tetratricopeptide repeat protein [Verrucomicrobiota bacterium]
MARAAAKQRPPARRHDTGRKHKDSGGQRYEDTLFFNRLRTHAKWVFVLLIVVFGLGFVLLGVGSSGLGLGDIFSGIRGGGGNASIDKPLKATEKNPKDAQAWRELATAYDAKGDYASGLSAWQQYTQLRPKDVDGLNALAQDYGQELQTQAAAAQGAQAELQQSQPNNLGPSSTSPLGRALGNLSNPLEQSVSAEASSRYQAALTAYQQTASLLVATYQRLSKLQPSEPGVQLQLAQAAESIGDATIAIAAYKRFIELAPDDASAPQARARIKTLEKQIAGSSSTAQG